MSIIRALAISSIYIATILIINLPPTDANYNENETLTLSREDLKGTYTGNSSEFAKETLSKTNPNGNKSQYILLKGDDNLQISAVPVTENRMRPLIRRRRTANATESQICKDDEDVAHAKKPLRINKSLKKCGRKQNLDNYNVKRSKEDRSIVAFKKTTNIVKKLTTVLPSFLPKLQKKKKKNDFRERNKNSHDKRYGGGKKLKDYSKKSGKQNAKSKKIKKARPTSFNPRNKNKPNLKTNKNQKMKGNRNKVKPSSVGSASKVKSNNDLYNRKKPKEIFKNKQMSNNYNKLDNSKWTKQSGKIPKAKGKIRISKNATHAPKNPKPHQGAAKNKIINMHKNITNNNDTLKTHKVRYLPLENTPNQNTKLEHLSISSKVKGKLPSKEIHNNKSGMKNVQEGGINIHAIGSNSKVPTKTLKAGKILKTNTSERFDRNALKNTKSKRKAGLHRNYHAKLPKRSGTSNSRKIRFLRGIGRGLKNTNDDILYEVKDFIIKHFPHNKRKRTPEANNLQRKSERGNKIKESFEGNRSGFSKRSKNILYDIKDFVLNNFHSERVRRSSINSLRNSDSSTTPHSLVKLATGSDLPSDKLEIERLCNEAERGDIELSNYMNISEALKFNLSENCRKLFATPGFIFDDTESITDNSTDDDSLEKGIKYDRRETSFESDMNTVKDFDNVGDSNLVHSNEILQRDLHSTSGGTEIITDISIDLDEDDGTENLTEYAKRDCPVTFESNTINDNGSDICNLIPTDNEFTYSTESKVLTDEPVSSGDQKVRSLSEQLIGDEENASDEDNESNNDSFTSEEHSTILNFEFSTREKRQMIKDRSAEQIANTLKTDTSTENLEENTLTSESTSSIIADDISDSSEDSRSVNEIDISENTKANRNSEREIFTSAPDTTQFPPADIGSVFSVSSSESSSKVLDNSSNSVSDTDSYNFTESNEETPTSYKDTLKKSVKSASNDRTKHAAVSIKELLSSKVYLSSSDGNENDILASSLTPSEDSGYMRSAGSFLSNLPDAISRPVSPRSLNLNFNSSSNQLNIGVPTSIFSSATEDNYFENNTLFSDTPTVPYMQQRSAVQNQSTYSSSSLIHLSTEMTAASSIGAHNLETRFEPKKVSKVSREVKNNPSEDYDYEQTLNQTSFQTQEINTDDQYLETTFKSEESALSKREKSKHKNLKKHRKHNEEYDYDLQSTIKSSLVNFKTAVKNEKSTDSSVNFNENNNDSDYEADSKSYLNSRQVVKANTPFDSLKQSSETAFLSDKPKNNFDNSKGNRRHDEYDEEEYEYADQSSLASEISTAGEILEVHRKQKEKIPELQNFPKVKQYHKSNFKTVSVPRGSNKIRKTTPIFTEDNYSIDDSFDSSKGKLRIGEDEYEDLSPVTFEISTTTKSHKVLRKPKGKIPALQSFPKVKQYDHSKFKNVNTSPDLSKIRKATPTFTVDNYITDDNFDNSKGNRRNDEDEYEYDDPSPLTSEISPSAETHEVHRKSKGNTPALQSSPKVKQYHHSKFKSVHPHINLSKMRKTTPIFLEDNYSTDDNFDNSKGIRRNGEDEYEYEDPLPLTSEISTSTDAHKILRKKKGKTSELQSFSKIKQYDHPSFETVNTRADVSKMRQTTPIFTDDNYSTDDSFDNSKGNRRNGEDEYEYDDQPSLTSEISASIGTHKVPRKKKGKTPALQSSPKVKQYDHSHFKSANTRLDLSKVRKSTPIFTDDVYSTEMSLESDWLLNSNGSRIGKSSKEQEYDESEGETANTYELDTEKTESNLAYSSSIDYSETGEIPALKGNKKFVEDEYESSITHSGAPRNSNAKIRKTTPYLESANIYLSTEQETSILPQEIDQKANNGNGDHGDAYNKDVDALADLEVNSQIPPIEENELLLNIKEREDTEKNPDGPSDAESSSIGYNNMQLKSARTAEESGDNNSALHTEKISENAEYFDLESLPVNSRIKQNSDQVKSTSLKQLKRFLNSIISLKEKKKRNKLSGIANHRNVRSVREASNIENVHTILPAAVDGRSSPLRGWFFGLAGLIIVSSAIVGIYQLVLKHSKNRILNVTFSDDLKEIAVRDNHRTSEQFLMCESEIEMEDRWKDDSENLFCFVDHALQKFDIPEVVSMKKEYSDVNHLSKIRAIMGGYGE